MRWSIVGLMLLGVVAAGCAAALVASLRANARGSPGATEDPAREVEVIVAARAIGPMTIVEADAVTTSKMPQDEVPAKCYQHPSAVVGRVLAIPVIAGQPLTQDCFKTEGPLAPFLPDGMRAVTLPLSPSDAGMIYPGSIVDVLVSLTRPAVMGGKTDEAISFALLQGIEVLAIDGHTIVGEPEETTNANTRGPARHQLVTLMVDPQQAKALQLAVKYGKVSLSLRNPLDADRLQKDPTPLMDLLEYEENKDAQASSDVKNRRMQVTILRGGVEEVKWVSRSVGEQRTAKAAKLASYPADAFAHGDAIRLDVGRQMILRAPWPAKRVSVTDPKIADVQIATPEQVLLMGKSLGTTDLVMWSEDEETWQTRVDVGDIARLKTELTGLFPECTLDVKRSENVVIVQGLLSSAVQVSELRDFLNATGLTYLDRTRLAGVQQVEIEVRVAEASRRALRELGINTTIRATTEHGLGQLWPLVENDFGTATVGPSTGLASLVAGFPHADLEVFLAALAENHYVHVLAEPNLTAASGEEARFLAGGEFPIPVVQGGAGGTSTAISIEYKEYGVALQFVPVVLGNNSIRLRVGTEVSRLSLTGAVVIEGFRVPAVETRRAETTLELRSGQMFGMAGLIEQDTEALNSRLPWLGDLPVLGPLFRSVRYERGETELVVLVRASLVEPLPTDSTPPLPGTLHVPPTDGQLYGEGRLEGTPPTTVPLPDATWRKELGLEWLRSPGTWARYDSPTIPSRSTLQLPDAAPPTPQDTEARTVASTSAASASSD